MAIEDLPEAEAVLSLRARLIQRLPLGLQNRVAHFDAHQLPKWQEQAAASLHGTKEFLGPLWSELRTILRSLTRKIATSGPGDTLGGTFRNLCFVGLNRAELLLANESQSVFNENWNELAGDNIKRHTALMFFAPRGLDGKPVNPYLFLVGENIPDDAEMADPGLVALAEQAVGPMALVDLCRIAAPAPNTVNLLLVADTLFHWDIKDNYVLPTSPTSWTRDLDHVLKTYPRTTRATLYTQWETDLLPPSERITVRQLRDMPLDDNSWLNKPTLQERYGFHMLVIGLATAALVYAGLWYQGSGLDDLTDQLNVVEQQIPRGGQFSDLERAITEQEKMWQKRQLFGLVVKDTGRAIQNSGMKIISFEARVGEVENPPVTYVVTIDAKPDAYQGWLQQEPIARNFLLNSALLDAVRKPPTTNGFKLEALVNAESLLRQYKPLINRPPPQQRTSSSIPAPKSLNTASSPQFGPAAQPRTTAAGIEPAAGRTAPVTLEGAY